MIHKNRARSPSLLLPLLCSLSLKARLIPDEGGDRVEESDHSHEPFLSGPKSYRNQCRSREEKAKERRSFLKKMDRLSEDKRKWLWRSEAKDRDRERREKRWPRQSIA